MGASVSLSGSNNPLDTIKVTVSGASGSIKLKVFYTNGTDMSKVRVGKSITGETMRRVCSGGDWNTALGVFTQTNSNRDLTVSNGTSSTGIPNRGGDFVVFQQINQNWTVVTQMHMQSLAKCEGDIQKKDTEDIMTINTYNFNYVQTPKYVRKYYITNSPVTANGQSPQEFEAAAGVEGQDWVAVTAPSGSLGQQLKVKGSPACYGYALNVTPNLPSEYSSGRVYPIKSNNRLEVTTEPPEPPPEPPPPPPPPEYYSVTILPIPKDCLAGGVIIKPFTGTAKIEEGSTLDLEAKEGGPWEFVCWRNDYESTDPTGTVTVDGEMLIIVCFTLLNYPVTIKHLNEEDRSVGETVPEEGTYYYEYDSPIKLQAWDSCKKGSDEYIFKQWEDGRHSILTVNKHYVSKMSNAPLTFIARYTRKYITVYVKIVGGGSATVSVNQASFTEQEASTWQPIKIKMYENCNISVDNIGSDSSFIKWAGYSGASLEPYEALSSVSGTEYDRNIHLSSLTRDVYIMCIVVKNPESKVARPEYSFIPRCLVPTVDTSADFGQLGEVPGTNCNGGD